MMALHFPPAPPAHHAATRQAFAAGWSDPGFVRASRALSAVSCSVPNWPGKGKAAPPAGGRPHVPYRAAKWYFPLRRLALDC